MIQKEDILQALREVRHPGRQDRDIVELGMVQDVEIAEKAVSVTLASRNAGTRWLNTSSAAPGRR